jgi:formylglycine-generating enzyme required for sulfatase activity
MSGNVWEWTATPYQQPQQVEAEKYFTPTAGVVLRGVSYWNEVAQLCCGARFRGDAGDRDYSGGFRLFCPLALS